jgi:hypothetical protein
MGGACHLGDPAAIGEIRGVCPPEYHTGMV